MQHFIYPENQYKRTDAYGTLKVEYDPDDNQIRIIIVKTSGGKMIRLPMEAAAMAAGFILSKHPAIVKGDAMAFSSVTRACDAIPEPDFTVTPPGHELLAKSEKQDTKDDDQDVKVNVTSPDPESAKRATDAFADHLSNMWVAKDDPLKDTPHPSPVITEAQYEELRRLQADAPTDASAVVSRTWVAKDDDQDTGDLHPDQERRLTALREANEILGGRLYHDQLLECAEWILNGDTGKED